MTRFVCLVWFLVFLLWAIYRAYFFFPETIDEFLVKPLIFVLPVLVVVAVKEKRGIASLGLSTTPLAFITDVFLGVLIGTVFAFEGLAANMLKYGQYSFTPIAQAVQGGVGMLLLLSLVTAFSEEVLARGYVYKRLEEASQRQLPAALFSSFLFFLLHVPIMFTRLHLMGTALLVYPFSIFLLGVVNAYLFSFRKSLFLPILVHAFFNITVTLYL